DGAAMEPSARTGQRLGSRRAGFRLSQPQRGDADRRTSHHGQHHASRTFHDAPLSSEWSASRSARPVSPAAGRSDKSNEVISRHQSPPKPNACASEPNPPRETSDFASEDERAEESSEKRLEPPLPPPPPDDLRSAHAASLCGRAGAAS